MPFLAVLPGRLSCRVVRCAALFGAVRAALCCALPAYVPDRRFCMRVIDCKAGHTPTPVQADGMPPVRPQPAGQGAGGWVAGRLGHRAPVQRALQAG